VTIRIHIDRLVLDGFSLQPDERSHVQAALEAELARLARTGDAQRSFGTKANSSHQGKALAFVEGGPFSPRQNEPPRQLGKHIARSVWGGIERMR